MRLKRSSTLARSVQTVLLSVCVGLGTLIVALTLVTPTQAQTLVDPRGRGRANAGDGMSLDEAVRMAERRYKAKAVRAQTEDQGGRRVHVIRLLNGEGKVWEVRIDANTG